MFSHLATAQDKVVKQQATNKLRSVTGDINLKEALWITTVQAATAPKFNKYQKVCFIGGVGTVLRCQPESGTWTYIVEMELGPEPDMGRVGSETRILLQEADIQKVMN